MQIENVYVPIEISDLREVLPPNEKIIYSTICLVSFKHKVGGGATRSKTFKVKYETHVLITPRGFAFFRRSWEVKWGKLKLFSGEPEYNSLLDVSLVLNNGFKFQGFLFKFIYQPNFESEETFKERSKKFKMILFPYLLETTQTFIAYVLDNKEKEIKDDSPLWKINSNFFKNGFIDLNFDQIQDGEVLRKKFDIVNDKLTDKKLFLNTAIEIKHILKEIHGVAYAFYDWKTRDRIFDCFLYLRGLGWRGSIFSDKYIKYLKKELIRWQKLFDQEKKLKAKLAQKQMKKKK